jgi:ribosome-binding protein aMBF1 (putative translation factor)
MRKNKETQTFDFRPLGLAIREAREKAGLSRNDLGDKVFYGERHIADIENIGKHPSFQLFHDLVTIFRRSHWQTGQKNQFSAEKICEYSW